MTMGLETYSAGGALHFNSDSLIGRVIASGSAYVTSTPVSITVPGLINDGTYHLVPSITGLLNYSIGTGSFTLSAYSGTAFTVDYIVVKNGGALSGSGYGFQCATPSGNAQIDNTYTNLKKLSSGSLSAGGTIPIVSGATLYACRPSATTGTLSAGSSSNSTGVFNVFGAPFDWVAYGPFGVNAASQSRFGFEVFDPTGNLIFTEETMPLHVLQTVTCSIAFNTPSSFSISATTRAGLRPFLVVVGLTISAYRDLGNGIIGGVFGPALSFISGTAMSINTVQVGNIPPNLNADIRTIYNLTFIEDI